MIEKYSEDSRADGRYEKIIVRIRIVGVIYSYRFKSFCHQILAVFRRSNQLYITQIISFFELLSRLSLEFRNILILLI